MKKDKYAVGTAEIGTICHWPTLKEAREDAKNWAAGEPGTSIIVFALDHRGEVGDVVEVFLVENEQKD